MKKFFAFVMAITMVMSVMVMGPAKEAFAASGYVCGVHEEDVETANDIFYYGAKLINTASNGEYTVVHQDMGPSPDGTGYDWYITAYNHELKQYETDMAHIDDIDEYVLGLIILSSYDC